MAIKQLTTANTFNEWLNATQSLIETANTLTDGNGATFTANTKLEVSGTGSLLNVRTSGSINVFYSNTGTLANVIATNASIANVNVTNRIVFSDGTALDSNTFITRAFAQANAAFLQANTPSAAANSAGDYANSAFNAANSQLSIIVAGSYANSAFLKANTPDYVANSAASYANAAFVQANTPPFAANSAGSYANSSFVTANASFIRANAAFIRANNSLDANSGGTITGTVSISTGVTGTSLTATANIQAPLFVGVATSARYADLAEIYETDQIYSVGTVMMVGGEKETTACIEGFRPLGAISVKPGYLMNMDAEGQAIALKGRIPIRVIGSVVKGLPLVISATPGVAMQGTWNDNYFAISLETSNNQQEKLIEGVVL